MEELKPCPFCGSTVQSNCAMYISRMAEHPTYYIECSNESCIAAYFDEAAFSDEQELIEAWNRRA